MTETIRKFFADNCEEQENGLNRVNQKVLWYLTLGVRGGNVTYLSVKGPNENKFQLIGSVTKVLDGKTFGHLYPVEKNVVFLRVRDNIKGPVVERHLALSTLKFKLDKVSGPALKSVLACSFGGGAYFTKGKKKQDESLSKLAVFVAENLPNPVETTNQTEGQDEQTPAGTFHSFDSLT